MRRKVLIIEDEESVRHALARILENYGHAVVLAGNWSDGRRKFEGDGFDIVFTDLSLPGPSGWDVADDVKAMRPGLPVVLLSGWDVSEEERKRHGAVDRILSKPVKIKDMLQAIDDLAGDKEARAGEERGRDT